VREAGDRLGLGESPVRLQDQIVAATLDQPRCRGVGAHHGLGQLRQPSRHAVDVEGA